MIPMINHEWKKVIDEKYPNNNFTNSEIARLYLLEVKGLNVSNRKRAGMKNKLAHKCPTCGRDMIAFPLCGSCELSVKSGYKTIFICPCSDGILQKVNTDGVFAEQGEKAYKDYFLLSNLKTGAITCKQMGILSRGIID